MRKLSLEQLGHLPKATASKWQSRTPEAKMLHLPHGLNSKSPAPSGWSGYRRLWGLQRLSYCVSEFPARLNGRAGARPRKLSSTVFSKCAALHVKGAPRGVNNEEQRWGKVANSNCRLLRIPF